jgi:hypothetical protein
VTGGGWARWSSIFEKASIGTLMRRERSQVESKKDSARLGISWQAFAYIDYAPADPSLIAWMFYVHSAA